MNRRAAHPADRAAAVAGALCFERVALVGKPNAAGSGATLARVVDFLHAQGCEVTLEHDTAQHVGALGDRVADVAGIGAHCQLALVVGGDGTMLGIGRRLAPWGVPLIGINQGRLGFITDIPFDGFEAVLRPMLCGAYLEERRALLQAGVWRDGHCEFDTIAMNDVVVNRGGAPSMVELRVEVDGHFVANMRADGLIIASPTGSTAYALSAGGPLLHPAIDGWVMVPIAPHTLSNRPVVLPASSTIAIEVVAARDPSAHFDMQTFTSLLEGDRIVVRRSQHVLRLLHPLGWNYFDTLRGKLHWNEGVVA
ncbi:NAD kinase [Tepidimonas alkaliphilus]|uniref:NAD kinase n=1 Tax=Tepidimonas alkaliphilus TaxID=2588942 RepID=UPI0011807A5E|nr:NAD kinase [Tepidimonas alkaliphilus]